MTNEATRLSSLSPSLLLEPIHVSLKTTYSYLYAHTRPRRRSADSHIFRRITAIFALHCIAYCIAVNIALQYITLHCIEMYCIALHHNILHWITIHDTALIARYCIARYCVAFHYNAWFALHCIALHCNALHCIALHCIALHYIALHCIALHCIALLCIVLHYITLQWFALHCISLHFIAFHCISLHYIASHHITLQYIACIALHCIALHCIVLHCIALQCIAVYCISLHYIALHCIVLYCIALYCIALNCIKLHLIALQRMHYNALHCHRGSSSCEIFQNKRQKYIRTTIPREAIETRIPAWQPIVLTMTSYTWWMTCFTTNRRHLFNVGLIISSLTLHCHLHPLQAANSYRNYLLVVDEDNLKWVRNQRKLSCICKPVDGKIPSKNP